MIQPRGRRAAGMAEPAHWQTDVVLFIVGAVLGGLVAGAVLGGSMGRLEQIPLHRVGPLVVAVVVQLLASLFSRGPLYVISLLLSLVLAALFVFANRHLAGQGLLLGGLGLNALVVALNGAMPVQRGAARRAGMSIEALAGDPRHTTAGPRTHLGLLGDRIPLALPWQPQVLSIGDLLVAAGAGLLISAGMRRRTHRPEPVPQRALRAAGEEPRRQRALT